MHVFEKPAVHAILDTVTIRTGELSGLNDPKCSLQSQRVAVSVLKTLPCCSAQR